MLYLNPKNFPDGPENNLETTKEHPNSLENYCLSQATLYSNISFQLSQLNVKEKEISASLMQLTSIKEQIAGFSTNFASEKTIQRETDIPEIRVQI